MLTQQQKNHRRKRATPEQLAFLRKSFMIDPRPDQNAREAIGRQIDMTPRSVQIWFQNNRAKSRNQERKMKTACHLPLKTSIRNGNISRIHVDFSAVKDFPEYMLPKQFYQHSNSPDSASVSNQQRTCYRSDTPVCSEPEYHSDMQYETDPIFSLGTQSNYRSDYGSHNGNNVLSGEYHTNNDYTSYYMLSGDECFQYKGVPRTAQENLYGEKMITDYEQSPFAPISPELEEGNVDLDSIFWPSDQHTGVDQQIEYGSEQSEKKSSSATPIHSEFTEASQLDGPLISPEVDFDLDNLFTSGNVENVNSLVSNNRQDFSIF